MARGRILFFATRFFNYQHYILDELVAQGFEVDYYNALPTDNGLFKGILKKRPNWLRGWFHRYFERIFRETAEISYDYILLVDTKYIGLADLQQLRTLHPESKLIFYTWDSLANYPWLRQFAPYFDQLYSFDPHDCASEPDFSYLPLFYCHAYGQLAAEEKQAFDYDLVSICTVHPNRLAILRQLLPQLRDRGVRVFSYMYIHILQYAYNLIADKMFRSATPVGFKFRKLTQAQIVDLFRRSRTVFDIQHNLQSGMTMRTFETLGAHRKLITTNESVRRTDFYHPNNIFVFEGDCSDELIAFIRKPYVTLPAEIYEKYSLTGWVQSVLGLNGVQA